jgi:SpoIID/LytB domain protein
MFEREPLLDVGIIDGTPVVEGEFQGDFLLPGGEAITGRFSFKAEGEALELRDAAGREVLRSPQIRCTPASRDARFLLRGVTIGVHFHWERKEDQVFEGSLKVLRRKGGGLVAVNEVLLEPYLLSVVSSEMSANAPLEFLKAHAITSRSWLAAMLVRKRSTKPPPRPPLDVGVEIVRWYTREDHDLYDVCADDHCQRYQGITKIFNPAAQSALAETRGTFLVHGEEICDARFYKACGGRTEDFENAWEDVPVPYLRSVSDSPSQHPAIDNETAAESWMMSRPEAYCNTADTALLRGILPDFDQETKDFFRWTVGYSQEELRELIGKKAGMDPGPIAALEPLSRGPSGRIFRLKITGADRTVVVGKELEIRRWLSPSHLYSSAFVVKTDPGLAGIPRRFTLHGAGWGHGVGLCQIGAAVMSTRGFDAEAIVTHYFPGSSVRTLY